METIGAVVLILALLYIFLPALAYLLILGVYTIVITSIVWTITFITAFVTIELCPDFLLQHEWILDTYIFILDLGGILSA